MDSEATIRNGYPDPATLVVIPGQLTSAAYPNKVVAASDEIYDFEKGMPQSQINIAVDASIQAIVEEIGGGGSGTVTSRLDAIDGSIAMQEEKISELDSSVSGIVQSLSDVEGSLQNKVQRPDSYTPGNFAVFDASGNVVDSSMDPSSFTGDYNKLVNIPTINDVSIYGAKTGADLHLVDASDGWGLSQENYTIYEKEWVAERMRADLQEDANGNYNITTTTSPSNLTYYTDDQSSLGFTAEAYITFAGSFVTPTNDNGWTKIADGKYQKAGSTSSPVPSASWNYVPGGKYGTIEVNKSSAAKSTTPVNPAYWGFAPSNNAEDIDTYISSICAQNRLTAPRTSDTPFNVTNSIGTRAYLWVVTHGSATATVSAISIMEGAVTKSFTSPRNSDIQMNSYKVYISTQPVDPNETIDSMILKINL